MKKVSFYSNCKLCPRNCGVNRNCSFTQEQKRGKTGYCQESAALRLACASIHWGEEPPISSTGKNETGGGSGTIFASGCNLGCVFCQNYQISKQTSNISPPAILGRVVDKAEFAQICLALQKKGALNINIVTGSHAVPAIAEGIAAAKKAGLNIPVLWNSSAYELPETLELLNDGVDIFLPDLKTLDSSIAGKYFNAPDYPLVAVTAIKKMLEMRPLCFIKQDSQIARLSSGVMIRHLVLPGHLEASREVLRWFAEQCKGRALLSLMFQFTPINDKGPDRYITKAEYSTVIEWLSEFGIENGYCQELVPESKDWLPDFEKPNPFPSDLSIPVWHWKTGFVFA